MMTLNPLSIIFYVFSSVAIVSAICVITARHPVRSVLSLVITFFAMAGIWMLLRAEFLSLILLLVYVGAVMTLFLFVVMMLDVDREGRRENLVRYFPVALLMAILIAALLIESFYLNKFSVVQAALQKGVGSNALSENNLQALGQTLFTAYLYPFEIAGVILLAAIIAAITLTHRGPMMRRTQSISAQVDTSPKDAMRLVKMPVEKRTANSATIQQEGGSA